MEDVSPCQGLPIPSRSTANIAPANTVVTLAGQDHYLGPHGTAVSRREYDRLIAKYLANGRRSVADDLQATTVTQVLAAYWRFAQGYYVKNGKPTNEINAPAERDRTYGKVWLLDAMRR